MVTWQVLVDGEADLAGFIDRLREVPEHVVEQKQRAIESVRHKLLYNMRGTREDAFTLLLRQAVHMLAALPDAAQDGRAPLTPPPLVRA